MENTAKDNNTEKQTEDKHLDIETVTPDTVNVEAPAGEKPKDSTEQTEDKQQQSSEPKQQTEEPKAQSTEKQSNKAEAQNSENNQPPTPDTGGQEENINYYQEAKHEPLPGEYDDHKQENSAEDAKEEQIEEEKETPPSQAYGTTIF